MQTLWNKIFLIERPSFSLSIFRIAAAMTTIFHVAPTLCLLDDNYFPTAFKTHNGGFFTLEILKLVLQSPNWLIIFFTALFAVSSFSFLIGFLSQASCILMTMCCYYFYALNAFHVGTLSWDILLVTLFLLCLVPYHGDYFSADCLLKKDVDAYKRKRPYFMQRLLQLQIGFTFMYTDLYKIYPEGNWLTDNPLYYVMNYPPAGTTKNFLLRDFLMYQPDICYIIGLMIVAAEFSMIFLLFHRRTRISAIYLGCVFHVLLILTLDVPAIFFFLFPPQLVLFINPEHIVRWIEERRERNQLQRRDKIIYDGNCQFCLSSIRMLKTMDLFDVYEPVNFHDVEHINNIHKDLTVNKAMSQLHVILRNGSLLGGFFALRKTSFSLPMMWPLIPFLFFPGMGLLGPVLYKFIAKNRYIFHSAKTCRNNTCFK